MMHMLIFHNIKKESFILPDSPTDTQKQEIEHLAQSILDTRANYPTSTLADLYDPLTMPPDLLKAHKTPDKAVDKLYRKGAIADDAERVAFLFEKYEEKVSVEY